MREIKSVAMVQPLRVDGVVGLLVAAVDGPEGDGEG